MSEEVGGTYLITINGKGAAWDDESPVGLHITNLKTVIKNQNQTIHGQALRIRGNMEVIRAQREQLAALGDRKGEHQ